MDAFSSGHVELFDSPDMLVSAVRDECGFEVHGDGGSFAAIVEATVDVLISHAVLMPSGRWDEDCHRCDERLGDHRLDGRCPA